MKHAQAAGRPPSADSDDEQEREDAQWLEDIKKARGWHMDELGYLHMPMTASGYLHKANEDEKIRFLTTAEGIVQRTRERGGPPSRDSADPQESWDADWIESMIQGCQLLVSIFSGVREKSGDMSHTTPSEEDT